MNASTASSAQAAEPRGTANGTGFENFAADYGNMMETMRRNWEEFYGMIPFAPQPKVAQLWMDNYMAFIKQAGQDGMMGFASDPSGTSKRMYEQWVDLWSKSLDAYFRSPDFAAKSGRDLEALSEWKKWYGQWMESYWASVHLPSTADMRDVYQKLYVLDRKLDNLEQLVRDLRDPKQQAVPQG